MKIVIDGWAWLDKSALTAGEISKLKEKLTLYPRPMPEFPGDPPAPIKLYKDSTTQLGVARQFFLEKSKKDHDIEYRLSDGDKNSWTEDLKFKGTLFPDQQHAVNALFSAYNTGSLGGLLKASTGVGKSVIAVALINTIKVPTLILVHKGFLLDQFAGHLKNFLPEARVGIVQQDTFEVEGKHVVIAMVQTLTSRPDYVEKMKDAFGMLIFDENHHVSSATLSQIPPKFNARFRLGLSATLTRADGCENAFYYHLGPVIHEIKALRMAPKIRRVWTDFKLIKTEKLNPNNISRSLVIKFLCANTARNKLIVEQILQAVKADRKILVLSERLKHLTKLSQMLAEAVSEQPVKPTMGFCVGGMDEQTIKMNCEAQVLFGTVQMVSEAFDHPPLDTLFLTTPVSNVTQSVGRICRSYPGKKDPVVVDFRDDQVGRFFRAAQQRDKAYEKLTGHK